MHDDGTASGRGSDIDPTRVHETSVNTNALMLDVREKDEWDKGHAPGATHIPLGDLDPASFDPGRPVITICRSGNRSGKAADALAEAGISVRNMTDGMSAWQEAGLPVICDDGTPGTI